METEDYIIVVFIVHFFAHELGAFLFGLFLVGVVSYGVKVLVMLRRKYQE